MSENCKIFVSYVGSLEYSTPDSTLLIEKDADYVRACHTLLQHWKSNTDLRIWVRLRPHYTWLQDFAEQIVCPALFEEKTPRLVLVEQWNVELPHWLTDTDVLEHDLLQIKVDSRDPMRFETRFLSHFLGAAFNSDVLNSENLVSVVKSLVNPDTKATFMKQSLLDRCLKQKCALWIRQATASWIQEVCTRMSDDVTRLWHCLSVWAVLHGYPDELLEYVLTPDQVVFVRKVPAGAVSGLPLESVGREQALTQIEQFFDEIGEQVNTNSKFKKIVDMVSGLFSQEYRFALNILKNKQFEPTVSDIQALRTKFELCPGISQNQLNSLKYLVKPDMPTLPGPQDKWGISEWIDWTTNEYIPYRAWQVHNKCYDSDLEKTVAHFSDWYIGEYISIHGDPDFSLTHCLTSFSGESSDNNLTVVLLVDCLPLHYVEIIDGALRNAGFSRHNISFRFAGLPTVTVNNKTALFAGNWLEDEEDYETILEKRATSDWGGKKAIYLSNLKSMSEMKVPQEAAVVVLNLLDADEILHSNVETRNIMFEDELHRLFDRVAEEVNRLSEEWDGAKEHFNLYVLTDHGACRILEEERRSFDSVVVRKLFPNEKYRFSVVDEEYADDIPQNLWEIGHRFKPPFVPERPIYFIPRGHNTVRQASVVKGHVHGGATPEEVIVPVAHYKPLKVAWKKPFARFLNLRLSKATGRAKFYIQRTTPIDIEVQNPNTAEISILRASIISPEVDLKGFETTIVPAGGVKCLTIECYFMKSALGERNVEIEIAYEIAGEKHILPLSLPTEFQSAQKGGFSLKDL